MWYQNISCSKFTWSFCSNFCLSFDSIHRNTCQCQLLSCCVGFFKRVLSSQFVICVGFSFWQNWVRRIFFTLIALATCIKTTRRCRRFEENVCVRECRSLWNMITTYFLFLLFLLFRLCETPYVIQLCVRANSFVYFKSPTWYAHGSQNSILKWC